MQKVTASYIAEIFSLIKLTNDWFVVAYMQIFFFSFFFPKADVVHSTRNNLHKWPLLLSHASKKRRRIVWTYTLAALDISIDFNVNACAPSMLG